MAVWLIVFVGGGGVYIEGDGICYWEELGGDDRQRKGWAEIYT